jgi:hypothetical protein
MKPGSSSNPNRWGYSYTEHELGEKPVPPPQPSLLTRIVNKIKQWVNTYQT